MAALLYKSQSQNFHAPINPLTTRCAIETVLNVQFRTVSGCFDVTRDVIYHDVPDFKYAENTSYPEFTRIETWVRTKYQAPPCPPGKILPLFFDCVNSECLLDEDTGSRYNLAQNSTAIAIIEAMLEANLGLKGSGVVVITPYRSNLGKLQQAFKRHNQPACRDVVVNTTDSFQGREGLVVVFVLCVTAKTGPLFVADPHRICVGITRQVGALFVVGDILTLPPNAAAAELRTGQTIRTDAGQPVSIKKDVFQSLLGYFRCKQRVVSLSASGEVLGTRLPIDSNQLGRGRGGGLGAGRGGARGTWGLRGIRPWLGQ